MRTCRMLRLLSLLAALVLLLGMLAVCKQSPNESTVPSADASTESTTEAPTETPTDAPTEAPTYTVTFVDYDGRVLKRQEGIAYGAAATAPENPTRDGYDFVGWNQKFDKVTSDMTVKALYKEKPDPEGTLYKWDCSPNGDGSVMMFLIKNAEEGSALDVIVRGKGPMRDYASPEDVPWNRKFIDDKYFFQPDAIRIEEGVTHVGDYAFIDRYTTTLYLPDSLESIGRSAFENTTCTFGDGHWPTNLKRIGDRAFANSGTEVCETFPASLEYIGKEAFLSCYARSRLNFAEGSRLTELDDGAFCGLRGCEELVLPASLRRIGENALYSPMSHLAIKRIVLLDAENWYAEQSDEGPLTLTTDFFGKQHPAYIKK